MTQNKKENDLDVFLHLVAIENWEEIRLDEHGEEKTYSIDGELWTKAFQAALDEHGALFIPARDKPYYLDAPLMLKSGNRIFAESNAEIYLKPNTNTCMVRNVNLKNGQESSIYCNELSDKDIIIEGGVWSTLATTPAQSNGNFCGCADPKDSFPGAHGTILLNNVEHITIKNLTIKECRPFGIQIGCCQKILIENITFDNTRRDGVHIGGPAIEGVVRGIRGITGDDMVALNAWDWKGSTMSFGTISDISVENVEVIGTSSHKWALNMRLLGGTKHYPDGATQDCNIERCTFKNIKGVKTFDLFDQPNLELGRENDFADPIGSFSDLSFENIHLLHNSPTPPFQIGSNINDLSISDIYLDFEPAPDFKLLQIGPQSETYKHNKNDPYTWTEIYSPDKDCTVKNLRLKDVYALLPEQHKLFADDLIHIVIQKLNPDYPDTTPKGGIGRGILVYENEYP